MQNVLPPIPRPLRLLALIVSSAVLVSAVGIAVLAAAAPVLARGQRPSWALFGFELVIAVASVLGALVGLGRFANGPGLALACVSGTILIGSGLGWQGAGRELLGVSLNPMLGGRLLAAMVLGGIGAWSVLSRDPRAIRVALRGGALIAPVVLGAAAFVQPAGRHLLDKVLATSPGVQFMVAVGGFAVVAVLLSAGLHLIIRAFEMGRPTSERA